MDDLRDMLDVGKYSKKNEKTVKHMQTKMVEDLLSTGYNVIVADTNLSPKRQQKWIDLAVTHSVKFEIKSFLDVSLEECVKRDLNRPKSVGKDVIMRMYNEHVKPLQTSPKKYKHTAGLYRAIICDIDGTLAHKKVGKGERSWYDWDRVGEDDVDATVNSLLCMYASRGYRIILLSGRDEVCRDNTECWLMENGVVWDGLFMREEGCNRKDSIIKEEIFWEDIVPNFNVELVIDDRLQVCRMWNDIGVKLFKVGDPDADF